MPCGCDIKFTLEASYMFNVFLNLFYWGKGGGVNLKGGGGGGGGAG